MSVYSEFYSRYSAIDSKTANSALKKERRKYYSFWQSPAGTMLMAVLIGVVAGVASAMIDGELGSVVSYAILFSGLIAFLFYRMWVAQKAMRNAPVREGVAKVSLSPLGYRVTHPGHESLFYWSHVEGVLTTPQGILILHSPYEYYPIEAAAFDTREQLEKVAEQIREWINNVQPRLPDPEIEMVHCA